MTATTPANPPTPDDLVLSRLAGISDEIAAIRRQCPCGYQTSQAPIPRPTRSIPPPLPSAPQSGATGQWRWEPARKSVVANVIRLAIDVLCVIVIVAWLFGGGCTGGGERLVLASPLADDALSVVLRLSPDEIGCLDGANAEAVERIQGGAPEAGGE